MNDDLRRAVMRHAGMGDLALGARSPACAPCTRTASQGARRRDHDRGSAARHPRRGVARCRSSNTRRSLPRERSQEGRVGGLEQPGRGRAPAGDGLHPDPRRGGGQCPGRFGPGAVNLFLQPARREPAGHRRGHARARHVAACGAAARPQLRDPDQPRGEPARGGVAGDIAQRGARWRGAVEGTGIAARHLQPLLHQHDSRGRSRRQPAHGNAAAGRIHGARQGAARQHHRLDDLPGLPRGDHGAGGGHPARGGGAALQADLRQRRRRQGNPPCHPGGAFHGRRGARLRLGDAGGRRGHRLCRPAAAARPGGAFPLRSLARDRPCHRKPFLAR